MTRKLSRLTALFLSALLLAQSAGALTLGAVLRQETLAAAQTRHDAVDPETETGAAAWTAAEQEVFGETQEKIDALKADNAALDESITAMEKEVETKLADEDTAYYNSVYEEMQKGVDQVEEYLKGN